MYYVQYILLRILFFIFSHISMKLAEKAADFTAFLLRSLFHYRLRVIKSNLALVYGNKLPMKEKELIKAIYRNFVYLWFEVLQAAKLTPENIEHHFRVHNREIVEDEIKNGKGVILISGHLGNFEWLASLFAFYKWDFSAIAKKQSNTYVDRFINQRREAEGTKVIYVKTAMKDGLKLLKRKGVLGIIGDQDARKKGIFVDFLGLPSSTVVGPAIFHLRSGAPLIWVSSIRRKYGRFDLYFEKIDLDISNEMNEQNIKIVTQAHADLLTKWVKKFPEQWFWMHRRWKTKLKQTVHQN